MLVFMFMFYTSIAHVHFRQYMDSALLTMEEFLCLSMPAVTNKGWLCMSLQRLLPFTALATVGVAQFKVVCIFFMGLQVLQ